MTNLFFESRAGMGLTKVIDPLKRTSIGEIDLLIPQRDNVDAAHTDQCLTNG